MSVIERLSSSLGRRDDEPNKELAAELARTQNHDDIAELVANLSNKDRRIQSDCVKTLYELGYIEPALIAPYVDDFPTLLHSRNSRLVWGGMIALSTVASLQPDRIYAQLDDVLAAIEAGSVITVDAGISVLARVAAASPEYKARILPILLEHLRTCRPQSVAQHAERAAVAVGPDEREEFIQVLNGRQEDLSKSQRARLRRLMRKI